MRKLRQPSLRDLFWLVALVAMGCGWWVERSKLLREVDRLKEHDTLWPISPGDRLEVSIDENGAETIEIEGRAVSLIELPAVGVELIDGVERKKAQAAHRTTP